MSMKAASKPANPMISTICGSAMPPTWVPRASPPSLRIRFTRFSFMPPPLNRGIMRQGGDRAQQVAGMRRNRACRSGVFLLLVREPLRVFFVALDFFSRFLDRFRVDLLGLVDPLFARLLVALDQLVQTF